MRRQVRNSRAWLPPGCQIVAYYWDVESGGDDLEDRGHGDAWQIAAATGIPRDGGIADLLNEAASPTPNFAFVDCEDIERSARDTYNSLKLERQLQDQGIPIFATDEPFNIEGINATTILVRRVKQGVAEWYRLQLKGKVWDGLKEHSLAGWNLGKVPIGYTGQKHPRGRYPPQDRPARHRRDRADHRTGNPRRPRRPGRPGPPPADPGPVHRPVHPAHDPGNRASRPRKHPRPAGQRPHPAGRTAVPGRHPHPGPRCPHRTAAGRLRHPSGLQPGQKPGHHPRHPHRRHPPSHQRPAHRPPRRPQHPATITAGHRIPRSR